MASSFSDSRRGFCAICGADISEYLEEGYYEDEYFYEPFICHKCGNEGVQVFQAIFTYIETNGIVNSADCQKF